MPARPREERRGRPTRIAAARTTGSCASQLQTAAAARADGVERADVQPGRVPPAIGQLLAGDPGEQHRREHREHAVRGAPGRVPDGDERERHEREEPDGGEERPGDEPQAVARVAPVRTSQPTAKIP